MKLKTRRASLAAAVLMASLALAACRATPPAGESAGYDVPEADREAEGSVNISGSSTVEPISALVREEFIAQNDAVKIDVDGPGTGDGFKLFCAGETDISDASRPIKAPEVEDCAANGIDFIELKVGIDGISVVASESNPLECLNFVDLYALVGPESEGFGNWTDAQALAEELGSDSEFPDENLVVTAPGAESGTFDSFVELVVEEVGKERVASGDISPDDVSSARDDYSAQPDDNSIIESAQADPGGLGWVGFAFAEQAEGIKLMPIAASPDDECVAPTQETIQDTSYPISRDLYIYVSTSSADSNEAVVAFVDFYIAGLGGFVSAADYIPLADDSETVDAWNNRITGSQQS